MASVPSDPKASTERLQMRFTSFINDIEVTISTAMILTVFFLPHFVPLPVNSESWTWLFVAKATPSPGWLFAPLLHAGIAHYVANVGQLLYFGVVPDRVLHRREYLGLLLIAGVVPVLIQVLIYNLQGIKGGLVGASGATMAIMGFTTAHLILYRFGWVANPGISNKSNLQITLLVVGVGWTVTQLFSDFYHGWTITPKASGATHLSGILLGIGYAIVRARDNNSIE